VQARKATLPRLLAHPGEVKGREKDLSKRQSRVVANAGI
jgi:hypothetical protein